MATSRSFTEYVKNKLDNKLWAALERFFQDADPSDLELRTNKVTEIGEVELDDTDMVFVDVFDLPGSAVAFNVVLNASIIVHDVDRYHNDCSDYTHQWFMQNVKKTLPEERLRDGSVYICTSVSRPHLNSNSRWSSNTVIRSISLRTIPSS